MRCYRHEPTDRPAVYSRTGFPRNDPRYDRLKAFLKEHTELKVSWVGFRWEPEWPVEVRVEKFSDDFDRRVETMHIPRGDLVRSERVSRLGQPGLVESNFVKKPADIARLLSLSERRPVLVRDDFLKVQADLGDAGIVEVPLGHNPAGAAVEWCGQALFAELSITAREALHRLCERRMREILALLDLYQNAGIGPFYALAGEEYLVPPMQSPGDFVDFNVRYDRPIVDRIHDRGGRVHIHCHGSLKKVFAHFVEMGVDVLHSVEAPPMGDLTAREAKAMARGRMTLDGNIQIHRLYEADPEAIREETARLIEEAFDDQQGLIVCPTASPYTRGAWEWCFPQYRGNGRNGHGGCVVSDVQDLATPRTEVEAAGRVGYRKSDLVREIAAELGMSLAAVERVLDRLASIAYREAPRGFVIPGIGKIKVVKRKASRHRNPITGELFLIGERRVVKMVPLKRAKEAIAPRKDVVIQKLEESAPGRPVAPASSDTPSPSPAGSPPSAGTPSPAVSTGLSTSQMAVPCPECGALVAFSADLADESVTCPNCHAVLLRSDESEKAPAAESRPDQGKEASAPAEAGDYILFRCRACSQEIEAPRDMIGMTIECPACGSALKIPSRFKAPAVPKESGGAPSSSTTMRIDLSDLE